MRGQGGAWSLVCELWEPGDPQFQRSLPVACGALPRATSVFPSYSWELNMESESKTEVKERMKSPDVGRDSENGSKALELIRLSYKWLPRVLQTRDKGICVPGSRNLPKTLVHPSEDHGNAVTRSSNSGELVRDNELLVKERHGTPESPKPVKCPPKRLKEYEVPDTVPLISTLYHSTTYDTQTANLISFDMPSPKSTDAVTHRKSDRKETNWSEEKGRCNKSPKRSSLSEDDVRNQRRKLVEKSEEKSSRNRSPKQSRSTDEKVKHKPKHKHVDKHSPISRKEHKTPTTSLRPVKDHKENENPFDEFDVSDRHPKCKLTLEEVKRKAKGIPKCLGSSARERYIRKIYVRGSDPDTWDWSQYDHAVLLTEPIIVIKDVPHRNCLVTKHKLRKMARSLPNLQSKDCFEFLCFYRGLDTEKTLRQIEQAPLSGDCPKPWEALEKYRNPGNPAVRLQFCKERKKFRCVEVKAACDHLLCSVRSGSLVASCLFSETGISRDSSAVSAKAAGDVFTSMLSTGGRPADTADEPSGPQTIYEDTAVCTHQPPSHFPNTRSIQDDRNPPVVVPSTPCGGASNSQAVTQASTLSSSYQHPPRPPSPRSSALPQPPPQTTELPLLRPPPFSFPASPQPSEPVDMDWMELESPEHEYHESCDSSTNLGCRNIENLDKIHPTSQNLSELPCVSNQDSKPPNESKITITGPASPNTLPAVEQGSPSTSSDPFCSQIRVFIEPTDYPNSQLSEDHMSAIENSILDTILEIPSGEYGPKPKFLQSTRCNGRFEVTCCDDFTRKWLYAYLGTHKPCSDVPLRIVSKDFRTPQSPPQPPLAPSLAEPKKEDFVEFETPVQEEQQKSSSTYISVTNPVPPNISPTKEDPSRMHQNEPGRRHMDVFIEPVDYPNSHLSDEQMTALENSILEAILEMDLNGVKPKFLQAIRRNGRYSVMCSDDFSRKWLYVYLGTHKPCPDVSLRISKDSMIPQSPPLPPLPPPLSETEKEDFVELESLERNEQQKSSSINISVTNPVPPNISSPKEDPSRMHKNELGQSHLPVFVEPVDYPTSYLSDEQMTAIDNDIIEAISEMDKNCVKPKFLQSIHLSGRYGVTCSDDLSRDWLYAYLETHKPCVNLSLRVVSKDSMIFPQSPPLPPLPPPLSEPKKDFVELESLERKEQQKSCSTNVSVTDPVPRNISSTNWKNNQPSRRHIPVFIEPIDYPNSHLSDEQMTAIENSIHETLSEIDTNGVKPKFLQSIRRNGRYGVTCSNDFSRKWLYAYLGTHKPWPNSCLRIVSKDSAEIRASAVLPLCEDEDNDRILKLIGTQNEGLDVSKWEVVQRWERCGLKTLMDLVIDEESAKVLDKHSQIIFKLGTGQILTNQKYNLISEEMKLKESTESDSSEDELYADLYGEEPSAESAESVEIDLSDKGIYSEFSEEKSFVRNSSAEDVEVRHEDHSNDRLTPNSEECLILDNTKLDCLRNGSEEGQSIRENPPGSSLRLIEREFCNRDRSPFSNFRTLQSPCSGDDCEQCSLVKGYSAEGDRSRTSRSPLVSTKQQYSSPKDDGSSASSLDCLQPIRSKQSSSSHPKQGGKSSRSSPSKAKAYSSGPALLPRCKPSPDRCEEGRPTPPPHMPRYSQDSPDRPRSVTTSHRKIAEASSVPALHDHVRNKNSDPIHHALPAADQETSAERIPSLISRCVQLDDTVSNGSKSSSLIDSGDQDPDQESSNSSITLQYDPDRPIQDVATEQFRKLIAAGHSCQEALKITQEFVSGHLNPAPQPEPPKAPVPPPQLEPTLHEVAEDKFRRLMAAGFCYEKALQFTQAFVRRQMGLLPPAPAFNP